MQTITRDQLNRKIDEGALVVEVLSPDNYEEFHIPDAINVPLGDTFETQIQQAVPDKSRDVVVYCYNTECDASPKAAKRMEELGYKHVYDYEAGKMDWKEAGLPVET